MLRVLVIDDEPLVAEMIRRTLEEAFEVVVRTSATDALALVDAGERFDAIVTDLAMPGLDGIALRDELARRHPRLVDRMLFLSGGGTTQRARQFLASPGIRALDKPFRADELSRRVREVAAPATPR